MAHKRRQHKRYTRRIEAEFHVNGRTIRGISSNISAHGIFIRTGTPLTVGSFVEIELLLQDGTRSFISGTVRISTRTNIMMLKNGMGVELTSRDDRFLKLLAELGDDSPAAPDDGPGLSAATPQPEAPPRPEQAAAPPEEPAAAAPEHATPPESIIVTCHHCGAKNRVRTGRPGVAHCGRCKAELQLA